MRFEVSGDFWDFLELLSRKKDGAPFCYYQRDIDFLYVICGEGPCSDWNRLSTGRMVFQGVDVIEKMWPEDCPGGDTFTGLLIWGGVRNFLSHNYKRILPHRYESYRQEHNAFEWPTAVTEIIQFLEEDQRGLVKPHWAHSRTRVMEALESKKPMVHIPLLELP